MRVVLCAAVSAGLLLVATACGSDDGEDAITVTKPSMQPAQESSASESSRTSLDEDEELRDGAELGYADGLEAGVEAAEEEACFPGYDDARDGRRPRYQVRMPFRWRSNIPEPGDSGSSLSSRRSYSDAFVAGYQAGYEEGFEEAFRETFPDAYMAGYEWYLDGRPVPTYGCL